MHNTALLSLSSALMTMQFTLGLKEGIPVSYNESATNLFC